MTCHAWVHAIDDSVQLAKAARIICAALAREGLTADQLLSRYADD